MGKVIINGELQVKDSSGNVHAIPEEDFQVDPHLDGNTTSFSYETDDFSVEITAENKDGAVSTGDWDAQNCEIIKDGVSFFPE